MAVDIHTQQDYLLTEANVKLPCELNALDKLMRESKATGRIVAQYSEGGLLGVHMEQKTKVRAGVTDKVRDTVGVGSREFNGHHK